MPFTRKTTFTKRNAVKTVANTVRPVRRNWLHFKYSHTPVSGTVDFFSFLTLYTASELMYICMFIEYLSTDSPAA